MIELALIADIIGFTGFTAAVIVLAFIPARADRRYNAYTKAFAIAAFSVYAYSLGVHLFGSMLLNPMWEEVENFIEVLFPVFALMSIVSMLSAQQYIDIARAGRALAASSDMVSSIVECAPAGIMVVDMAGCITFANDTARSILDLTDESGTGTMATPGWSVVDTQGRGRPDFRVLVEDRVLGSQRITVQWPTSWRVELEVFVEPLGRSRDAKAFVVAFERPRRSAES